MHNILAKITKITKSYSCRLPALEQFYRKTKSPPPQLRISKPS